jgi:enoyl-CoA hydratase/carnithine racemase
MPPFVAVADFVYCTEDAFFVIPFMSLNLATEVMSPITFPELIGRKKAGEMILLDQRITAKEAVKHGMANAIIPSIITEPILQNPEKCIPGL